MSWITIADPADILTVLSGPELDALRAAALAAGQVDPVQPAIDLVVDKVRGYIASCSRNKLDTNAATIPSRLKQAALDLIAIEIMKRAAGTIIDSGGQRVESAKTATRLLEQVARCEYSIDDASSGAEGTGYIQVARTGARRATRDTMEGL